MPAVLILMMAAVLVTAGCGSSSGYQKAETASRGLQATRDELNTVKADVAKATAALNDLVMSPKPDLRPQYNAYKSAVKTLQKDAMRARDRATDMRAKREAYVEAWRAQVQAIQNENMREQALKRMEKTREQFEKLSVKLTAAKEVFIPYMADLEDIQRYLDGDLSPGSVESVKDHAGDVAKSSEKVTKKIDEVVADLDKISSEISPVQAPPATTPASSTR